MNNVSLNVAVACLAQAGQLPLPDGGCVRCKKLNCSSVWADVDSTSSLTVRLNGTETFDVPEKWTALLEQSTSEHTSNQSEQKSDSFKNRTAEFGEVRVLLWKPILVTAAFAIILSIGVLLIIGTVGIVALCVERFRGTGIIYHCHFTQFLNTSISL